MTIDSRLHTVGGLDHLRHEATRFLAQMADELEIPGATILARLGQVEAEIDLRGTYTQTTEELTYGAKAAWRNHTRCLGKLYWRTLVVRDCRRATELPEFAEQLGEHLRLADNGGRIRPVLSVFAPDSPTGAGPCVLNSQLVQYAGYRQADGTVRGDPGTVALTDLVLRLGWRPPGGRFDILPVAIERHGNDRELITLPASVTGEVPLHHPTVPGFAGLGLRWYRFPTVANLRLEIGGISYPMAPFSGWYMCTEIATRNLGDVARYDALPAVARVLGSDTSSNKTLWRDRALIELNAAVLHSFESAGVRIVDHHTMTDQFRRYVEAEGRTGRTVAADWAWMVPPTSPSATPTFHMSFDPTISFPNFFHKSHA